MPGRSIAVVIGRQALREGGLTEGIGDAELRAVLRDRKWPVRSVEGIATPFLRFGAPE